MPIAEPIMDSYSWLCLPKRIQQAVRRAYCIDGADSAAYQGAVHVAREYWREHELPEPVGRR